MTEQPANSQDSTRYGWQPPSPIATAVSIGAPESRTTRKESCPECGERLLGRTDSCPACGANLLQPPKPIRCMHCHTTASSELVVCPGCGRELREAPPKLLTYGAPALIALLLVALLATQWERINPIAWARANLVRGVVLVEDISASIEPEMVIVMTPIVQEPGNSAANVVVVAPVQIAAASDAVSDTQTLAVAAAPESVVTPIPEANGSEGTPPTVVVAEESPVGVGGPEHGIVIGEASDSSNPAGAAETLLTPTPTVTDTPLPTATPETIAAKTEAIGVNATDASEPTLTPTPTWTLQATAASSAPVNAPSDGASLVVALTPEKEGVGGMAQMAALAAGETTSSTPTTTPTIVMTPLPTPTVTPVVYQVRSGDTIVTIAAAYDVEVEELMAANDMSEQDVYVIQPGQMLIIPVPTPEPVVASANDPSAIRVSAPGLLLPPDDAIVGCATGGTLAWERVQFVKDSDKYVLHLGFVSGRGDNGQESITWVVAQSGPVTQTEWQLDSTLCELAPADYDHQWRWWVEVVDETGGSGLSVSPPSDIRGFVWQ